LKESHKTALLVNNNPIEMNPFVEDLVARVSLGIVSSLKGVEATIRNVEIQKQRDNIEIIVNGKVIALTVFPVMIIESTLLGMLSVLKGVDHIKTFSIGIEIKTV
jgi:hypothetical protein